MAAMTEQLSGDELSFDRVANNRAAGAVGGRARTPEKLAAVRANIAKARIMREWYRRHPELRPGRLGAPQDDVR